MFEEKINSAAVKEYFATLGLDVWDAPGNAAAASAPNRRDQSHFYRPLTISCPRIAHYLRFPVSMNDGDAMGELRPGRFSNFSMQMQAVL